MMAPMTNKVGRSPDGSGSRPSDGANSTVVSTAVAASIPNAALLDELLHPLHGVERGLLSTDHGEKLVRIKVGELRKIGTCLRLVRHRRVQVATIVHDFLQARLPLGVSDYQIRCVAEEIASAIETQSATTAGRGPQDESAAPKVDAQRKDHD